MVLAVVLLGTVILQKIFHNVVEWIWSWRCWYVAWKGKQYQPLQYTAGVI